MKKVLIILAVIIVSLIIIDMATPDQQPAKGNIKITTGGISAIVYLRNNDGDGDKKLIFESNESLKASFKNEIFAKGTTPYSGLVEPGAWDIVVKAKGYKEFRETIKINSYEELTFDIKLEKTEPEGTLNLKTPTSFQIQ